MKKIPTLFKRVFENHRIVGITDEVPDNLKCVLDGCAVATVKYDGSCCAVINGEFYKRYDAKKDKKPPAGAIPCCEPDPITGHHPHWVKVDKNNPDDKWFVAALEIYCGLGVKTMPADGTYEAIGMHFNGNPYKLPYDTLIKHGANFAEVRPTFESIREYLENNMVEGIVFWLDGEPICKIKRSDFGFPWGNKK